MFWRCLVDCQLLYGRLWLRLWWASRNLSVWHFHWHWCTFFPSFRRTFCSRWSGSISRDWLDMNPVSGILCSSCLAFHGVWSLSVHWNDRPTWPSGLLFLRFLHKHDCLMLLQPWWFTSVSAFICSLCVFHTSMACVDAVGAVEQAEWYWGSVWFDLPVKHQLIGWRGVGV